MFERTHSPCSVSVDFCTVYNITDSNLSIFELVITYKSFTMYSYLSENAEIHEMLGNTLITIVV